MTLVGAGPGDPGLITLAGREALAGADVVVVDRLVSPDLVAMAPAGAEVVYAGKSPGSHHLDQDGICALLVERALAGSRVVRLKGGDPFVFGRGSEEIEACAAAGIDCSVVPGVTSAFGVPAVAGVPVTARGSSQAVTIVSGHLPPGSAGSTVDWAALARGGGTIVVLMGVAQLGAIAATLVRHGRPGGTPVAVVERGATPSQRTTLATLDTAHEAARAAGVRSPAIIVIGEVAVPLPVHGPTRVAAPQALLRGRRVLVPRSRRRPSTLTAALRDAGAEVLEITVARPVTSLDALPAAGWLSLRDEDEAHALLQALAAAGRDLRALAGVQVAAPADVAAVAGLVADAPQPPHGAAATRLPMTWEPLPPPDAALHAVQSGDIDAIALPSSGTAAALGVLATRLPAATRVVAMGERTSEAARQAGLRIDGVADRPGVEGLVRALTALFR